MKFFTYTISLIFVAFFSVNLQGQSNSNFDSNYKKALDLRYVKPDSSTFYFNKSIAIKLKEKDTTRAINLLVELGDLLSHNVNFGKAYDKYWDALLLADRSKDSISMASVYQGLGWMYSFYKRDELALEYFNRSIEIRKKFVKLDQSMERYILSNYFSIINLHRLNKNYDMVKVYLDSSYQLQNNISDNLKSYYLEVEDGFYNAVNGNFENAIKKLNIGKDYFETFDKSYHIIINTLFGDTYALKKEYNKSIVYYNKALEQSYKYNRHLNYRPIIHDALAQIYTKQNNYKEAYFNLQKAKELNDFIFGGRSSNNQGLLEIKDKFRIEKDNQEDLLKQQRITQLEHEDNVWFLQSIILVITILSIAVFSSLFFKQLRTKHKNEKRVLREKQRLRLQKQQEVLELKNKELTEAALRLIEKDEFISGIKKKLSEQKENIDVNVVKRLLKSIQGSPTKNWNEFEARFTHINQSFYKNLKRKFPKLSQTDQKICALVKLNFPSKDMARLLGISVESVHTSRYRLRKKLGLDRNDNLEEFINQF